MKFPLSFVIKPANWPSTTPTTDNRAGSAREGLISPSIVKSVELELAGQLMLMTVLLSRLCTQTSVLAIHCPYYRHTCRVHKGGTEWNSFYVVDMKFWWKTLNTRARLVWLMLYSREVGTSALWRWRMHLAWGIPSYSVQNYVDWSFPWFLFVVY